MQCSQKRHQSCRLGRAQVVAVGRHVAASLQDLPEQLIFGHPRRDCVECRPALSALSANGVTVPALHTLEDHRPLAFERTAAIEKLLWHGYAAPRVHVRRPWTVKTQS